MNSWDIDKNYGLPFWQEVMKKLHQLQHRPAPRRTAYHGRKCTS